MTYINSPQYSVQHIRQANVQYLKKIFSLVASNWYWLVACVILSLGGAAVFLKLTYPVFRVEAKVLIEEESTPGIMGADQLLEGFGLQPGMQNLDNQIMILSSWTLIKRALEGLPMRYDCYERNFLSGISYYPLFPVKVEVVSGLSNMYNQEFKLRYEGNNKVRVSCNKFIKLDTIVMLGSMVKTDFAEFSIHPTEDFSRVFREKKKIYFIFYDPDFLIETFQERLKVEAATNEGTIVNLSLEGTNVASEIIFLDELVRVFLARNLEKKNQEANRIIEFIESQLTTVTDSLTITETKLQNFRSRNRVMDISAQGQQIVEQAVRLEQEKAQLKLKANYYEYLADYLSKEDVQESPIAPSSMGIEDPLLTSAMQELASLQAEYFSGNVGEKNPLQNQLELRIRNTKQSLNETLQGIIKGNELAMQENQEQLDEMNSRASKLPRTERQLLGIEREFNLNNVLYTFLLQRRAEAQIQKASNKADNELVDPARANSRPISPNLIIVALITLFCGAGLPFIAMILIDSFNTRILSEEDLKHITNLPVVGHIPHSRLNYQTIVLNDPQSDVAESFRNLRTRMEFFTREIDHPLIMVSSSIPGEGKTFTVVNLASAYSLTGKKTVIVGFDLRRPKIAPDFEIPNHKGVSTYLIGKDKLDDIIFPTGYDNLFVIPAGPVPPNPSELTASEKARGMFEMLKQQFDFIVVDTAPVGVVSEGFMIATMADANILMVRHRISLKRLLEITLLNAKENGVSKLSLLINDLRAGSSSYKYAYSNKYYHSGKEIS